jgi:hypothetical protein
VRIAEEDVDAGVDVDLLHGRWLMWTMSEIRFLRWPRHTAASRLSARARVEGPHQRTSVSMIATEAFERDDPRAQAQLAPTYRNG